MLDTKGDWVLSRVTDTFTDEKSCSITNQREPTVYAFPNSLAVLPGRAGIKSFRMRVDEGAPLENTNLSDYDKSVGGVVLEKEQFQKASSATRLRLRINYGIEQRDLDYDLNMLGLPAVLDSAEKLGCYDKKG